MRLACVAAILEASQVHFQDEWDMIVGYDRTCGSSGMVATAFLKDLNQTFQNRLCVTRNVLLEHPSPVTSALSWTRTTWGFPRVWHYKKSDHDPGSTCGSSGTVATAFSKTLLQILQVVVLFFYSFS